MKKIWIILICIGAGLCVLTACIVIGVSLYNRLRFKNEALEYCRVSTGGGMLGGHRSVELRKQRDGSVTVTVSEQKTHADRERSITYPGSEEALAHIRELVTKHNLYGASKRSYSKLRVLDGDTTSISFSFDSDDFRVSEEQTMSAVMRAGFTEVERYLNSLAVGEGVETVEPQTATLYLRSGYTLQFTVGEAFDGRLDDILSEEREVSGFFDAGILLADGVTLDCDGAEPTQKAYMGTIVYDPQGRQIVVFYADYLYDHDVYELAALDGYLDSACPLIAEMEGAYRLYLNQ